MNIKLVYTFIFSFSFFYLSGQTITVNKSYFFNETELLGHLKILSSDLYEGRRTGTSGAERARKYIINEFYKLGVLKINKTYEQPFSFVYKGSDYEASNVIGLIKGTKLPNKYIIISAHYDHEGVKNGEIYNGADDNASGSSALFALADYYKKYPPNYSIILAAFDGEELGLSGSKYFLNNPIINLKNIKLNVNLDMISRSDKNELFAVGTSYNKSLKYIISNFKQPNSVKIITGHDGYDGLENWIYSSDHANFYKANIPFLYFGVEDHEDYHEPTDDFENIQPKFYVEAVNSIISVLNKIDNSGF
jgi:Zn-dependent M28 family amino/carboxypeptidase